jgi:hypothetical protein
MTDEHDEITHEYFAFAAVLGSLISECYPTEPCLAWEERPEMLAEAFVKLDEHEEKYASLGYRVVPLSAWIDFAGWDICIKKYWLQKRDKNEKPVFTKDNLLPDITYNGVPDFYSQWNNIL